MLRKFRAGAGFAFALAWIIASLRNGSLTFWACYWLFWFAGVFLVPELYWAAENPDNTLSDNTWRFESLNHQHPFDFSQWTPVHWIFAIVYVVFLFRLGMHLIFGLPLFRSWL